MGILNATPDSFSDGGLWEAVSDGISRAQQLEAEGCDVVDIGGESTRPGATPVPESEEIARVIPLLRALKEKTSMALSIDTYKAAVARQAVEAGAILVNDVWGLQRDPDMAAVIAETEAAVVVMHNRQETDPSLDIMDDVRRFLDKSLELAVTAGIPLSRIIVDPGVGFGKTPEQSMQCIHRLDELLQWYDLPVLLGLSRKRFIGHVLDKDVSDRLNGTLAANVIGLTRGARILRVHDVAEHVDAAKMFSAITSAP